MASAKPMLYSYIRWSSKSQELGSSRERQEAYALEVATNFELQMATDMVDPGVSGFKGKNTESGPLADFVDAVKAGAIPANSWLLVENLDRITRQDLPTALTYFIDLLRLGLTVFTAMDNKRYTHEAIKNPIELMQSLVLFSRAHEESATKAKRTNASARLIAQRHEEGIRAPNGSAYAIKSVGSNVWWADCSGGTVEPHEEYFSVAKDIVEKLLDGWGAYRITDYLNRYSQPPPPKLGKHGKWGINAMRRFPNNRALMGIKDITIDGEAFELKNYYPAIATEEEFYRIRQHKINNRTTTTSKTNVSLATGIGISKCGHCGDSLTFSTPRGKKLRYLCMSGSNKVTNCRSWSFNAFLLEDTLIRVAGAKIWRNPKSPISRIPSLTAKLEDLASKLQNVVDSLTAIGPTTALTKRYKEIEREIEDKKLELEGVRIEEAKHLKHTAEVDGWKNISEDVLVPSNVELRIKLRQQVSDTFSKIYAYKTNDPHMYKFAFEFRDGTKIAVFRSSTQLILFDSYFQELSGIDLTRVTDDDRVLMDEFRHKLRFLDHWGTPPSQIWHERTNMYDSKAAQLLSEGDFAGFLKRCTKLSYLDHPPFPGVPSKP